MVNAQMKNATFSDGASPAEMKKLMAAGAMKSLATAVAYCRAMAVKDKGRADAWNKQIFRFQEANPTRK